MDSWRIVSGGDDKTLKVCEYITACISNMITVVYDRVTVGTLRKLQVQVFLSRFPNKYFDQSIEDFGNYAMFLRTIFAA